MKYNRAFILTGQHSIPYIQDILNKTSDEDLEYWIIDSKESFHGEEDGEYFYFKDSRIDAYTKLPLFCVELEFSEEELVD